MLVPSHRNHVLPNSSLSKEFGDWIKGCYGGPPDFNTKHVGSTAGTVAGNGTSTAAQLTLTLSSPTLIDRVMVQEDLAPRITESIAFPNIVF